MLITHVVVNKNGVIHHEGDELNCQIYLTNATGIFGNNDGKRVMVKREWKEKYGKGGK